MKHPPYHLRPNKAVDRFMLVEAIKIFGRENKLAEYTYHGFGGPFLEDFRLLSQFLPEISQISVEDDEHTYKRQEFHRHRSDIKLLRCDFATFLVENNNWTKNIFWIDYEKLKRGVFDEFIGLLGRVTMDTLVKITIPAVPPAKSDALPDDPDWLKFKEEYSPFMPAGAGVHVLRPQMFARLIQDMLQIATQKALPAGKAHYQIVSSFFYKDKTQMFSLTGIVCDPVDATKYCKLFNGWQFANLNWGDPRQIDVPPLSQKERLHLEQWLPCDGDPGSILVEKLGYYIDNGEDVSKEQMKQYADFHKYFPIFVKAIP